MKIGLVIECLDPKRGGAEHWTHQFAASLIAAGHEVHGVATRFAPETADLGLVCHPVAAPDTRIGFAKAAEQALESLDLDVVHDMGCGWQCDIFQPHGGSRLASFEQNLLLLPGWLRGLKRQSAHWLARYRDHRRLMMAQYMSEQRIFVAISNMVARDFEHFHGVRREQIRVVYNGVDVERFSPRHRGTHRQQVRQQLKVSDEEVLLLIVAHNFRLKGVPALLEAVGVLRAQNQPVRLAVVGGKHLAGWQQLAHRLGAGTATTFVGAIADAVPLYAAADIYVQPTFYDPCSLVVLEALASGLPVITSRYNGTAELLTEGVEGCVLADPADVDELVATVRPILERGAGARMSTAARALATRHTLARNCQELLAVYDQVAGGRRLAA